MLEQVEAGEQVPNLMINVLQALEYIAKAWEEITTTTETIHHCWCHTKILPISMNADLHNLSQNTAVQMKIRFLMNSAKCLKN